MAFKRASLSGSAQLFQPTRVPPRETPEDPVDPATAMGQEEYPVPLVTEAVPDVVPQGHLYRLTDEEVETLVAALQHAKFPHSYQRLPKPPLEEFEQLEALRQKLVDQRGQRL